MRNLLLFFMICMALHVTGYAMDNECATSSQSPNIGRVEECLIYFSSRPVSAFYKKVKKRHGRYDEVIDHALDDDSRMNRHELVRCIKTYRIIKGMKHRFKAREQLCDMPKGSGALCIRLRFKKAQEWNDVTNSVSGLYLPLGIIMKDIEKNLEVIREMETQKLKEQ